MNDTSPLPAEIADRLARNVLCGKAACDIIVALARVAELADAQDLKSCEGYSSYRFDPGLGHKNTPASR